MEKVIVILGAGGLLGTAFSKYLLNKGHALVLADVNEASLTVLQSKISDEASSKRLLLVQVDATSAQSVSALIEKSVNVFGKVDALVNNIYPRNADYGKPLFDVSYDSFCDNISMNLGGYFLCSQKFSEYFITEKSGAIVNIASIYGSVAPKFEIYEDTEMTMPVEYSAIKSGVIHLTKYFARYLAGHQIRVNSLSPGGILDSQPDSFLKSYREKTLNKGMLEANDICGALAFLLSDESKYINGQDLIVDDGFTL